MAAELRLFTGCMFSGKCFLKGTKIMMYDGNIKRVENIKESELVMGDDGTKRQVKGICSGIEQIFRVSQEFGNDYYVNGSHILVLYCIKNNDSICITVNDYMKLDNNTKQQYKGIKGQIDLTHLYTKDDRIDIDPKLIGISISNPLALIKSKEAIDYVKEKIKNNEDKIFKKFTDDGMPDYYLYTTVENRRSLISGIWEGFSKSSIWSFQNTKITDLIHKILKSLMIEHSKESMCIKLKNGIKEVTTYDVKIVSSGTNYYYGFEVDKNHKFLLEDYTIVHNSSQLIAESNKYKDIGKSVIFINSILDSRTENNTLKTHDGIIVKCISTKNLMDIANLMNSEVIAIDEGQFFEDLVPFVKKMLSINKIVLIAGLDGNYKQEPFGNIHELICIADEYKKKYALCSICNDGSKAMFTKKHSFIMSPSDSCIMIGSKDKYIPVCRKHLS